MRTRRFATALLIVVTAIWGFTFVTNQDILKTLSPTDLLAWRFCIAALVMLVLKPKCIANLSREQQKQGLILGLLLGVGYVAQMVGLTGTTATASGFVTGMFVVFTPLVSGLVLHQRISAWAWLAVTLSAIGLGLIAFNGTQVSSKDLVTLICAISFAFQIVYLSRWSKAEAVYGLTTLQLLVTGLLSLVISLVKGGPQVPPDTQTWLSIIFLAVFASSLGFFAQTWVQSQVSATRAAIILTFEPVFAGIAGVTIGADELTKRLVIGSGFILVAMFLAELKSD